MTVTSNWNRTHTVLTFGLQAAGLQVPATTPGFAVSELFHEQIVVFMYGFCSNKEYILGNISRI